MIQINRYYPCHLSNYAVMQERQIEYIVIHYVGATGSAKQNAQYFSRNPGLKASAHYFVGHASENGAIYESVDPRNRAWHCGSETGVYNHPICRNKNSIGIEMCCHIDEQGSWYFDDITVEQTLLLVRELMVQYRVPLSAVLRHFDVTGKLCPAPMVPLMAWTHFQFRLEGSALQESTGNKPSDWAKEHTEWAISKGIINGDGRGNYDWQGSLTRESLATVLHNFALVYGLEKQ